MRGRAAYLNASAARATSCSDVRQSAATLTFRHSAATALTAAKSPSDAIGKPASMISTPRSWSFWAIRTFSLRFIEQPGDCSPSRKVVSKMLTLACVMGFPPVGKQVRNPTGGWANSQSYNLYRKINYYLAADERGLTQTIYPRYPRNLRLLSWNLGNAARVFFELTGVIEAG